MIVGEADRMSVNAFTEHSSSFAEQCLKDASPLFFVNRNIDKNDME